jgi:hypothetical protein
MREKNNPLYEIDHLLPQGVIMTELATETSETVVVVETEKPSRLKAFTVNHPRTAKVVGIVAITAATMGAVAAWKARHPEANETDENTEEDAPFDASSETA